MFALTLHFRYSYTPGSVKSYLPSFPSSSTTSKSSTLVPSTDPAAAADTATFWPHFYSALLAATPRCSLPHEHIEASISGFFPQSGAKYFQDLISLDEADTAELTTTHAWFVDQISSPSFPKPHFVPGSAGVVTSAGGEFLPEALVSIRMLRRTGSTLPVDVFLASREEVEGDICDTVMPALGARCLVLSELLDRELGGLPRRHNITRYQLKAFALLLSDLDNMVWMDADQIPVMDPRELLTSEPLRSRGLVTWPDYWFPTSSPLFYRVAGVPDDKVPPPGLRAASETGQLLISKSVHLRTLELVTYYNFHGPSHYYKLLSQGAVGEGDKETFLAAATALGAPFWAVQTPIKTIGYFDDGGEGPWHATGMLQAHPGLDFTRFGRGDHAQNEDDPAIPGAFLHSEQHKPNAGRYSRLWQTSVRQRMWQPLDEMVARFGYDIERAVWEEIVWTACGPELHGHVFRDWVDNAEFVDEGDVCAQARGVFEVMFGSAAPDGSGATGAADVEVGSAEPASTDAATGTGSSDGGS